MYSGFPATDWFKSASNYVVFSTKLAQIYAMRPSISGISGLVESIAYAKDENKRIKDQRENLVSGERRAAAASTHRGRTTMSGRTSRSTSVVAMSSSAEATRNANPSSTL